MEEKLEKILLKWCSKILGPLTVKEITHELGKFIIVTDEKNNQIASLSFYVTENAVHLNDLRVDEKYRNLGVGSSLITLVGVLYSEKPLIVEIPTKESEEFYKHLGFEELTCKDDLTKKLCEEAPPELFNTLYVENYAKLKPQKFSDKYRKFFII